MNNVHFSNYTEAFLHGVGQGLAVIVVIFVAGILARLMGVI